VSLIL
jgi:hypothetical protein